MIRSQRLRRVSGLIGVWLIFSQGVLAQNLPKIAVLPLPGESGQKAAAAVSDSLKATERGQIVELPEVENYLRNQDGSSKKSGGIKEANDKLKKGEEAYRNLDIKKSIRLLQGAKILYRQNFNSSEAFEGLRSAQFFLAMAFLANRQTERARDELRQIYIIDPERKTRKLSEKLYPPSIRDLFASVKKEFSEKPVGDLEIVSNPSGALAFVNGTSVGATPTLVKDLPVGEHFVRVVLNEQKSAADAKYIVSGLNRYEPDLNLIVPRNIYQYFETVSAPYDLDHQRVAFLDSMGVAIGAEIFVFLTPGNQMVKGQLYDQRSQAVSLPVSEKSPDLLAKKLVSFIGANGYVEAAPKNVTPPTTDLTTLPERTIQTETAETSPISTDLARQARQSRYGDGSWIRRNKLWLGIGGAVLVGVGVFFGLKSVGSKTSNNSVLTIQIP
ncbi:MAG: PEGA domain-containing protein [Bdellovibrionales bacterium]|nr:PEGA domain-containing protein [Bdellovibrionales bacterium]